MKFNANQTGAGRPARGVAVLLCGALLCSLLTGCRSSRPQDGTYTARYQYPSHGYVEYLTVTFRDGRAADVEFDAYSETDPTAKKSELTKEEYPMDPHPSEWTDKLEDNIEKAGLKADKIAGVAGATSSSRHARELYDAILTAARAGKTETILVKNEEDGPDSGMTGSSGNSTVTGNEDMSGINSGTDNGIGADSGTIPGASNGTDGSSVGDGAMSDGNNLNNGNSSIGNSTGSNASGDAPGKENASGGNGTGTGEQNSDNTAMSGGNSSSSGTSSSSVAP